MATKTEAIHRLFKLAFSQFSCPGIAGLPAANWPVRRGPTFIFRTPGGPRPQLAVNPSQIVADPR